MIIHQGVSMSELCTVSRLHKSEKHVASDPRAPRCFSANTFSPLHRSINHKPLSIAFGLKDKNGDRVLTINSEEHVISHLSLRNLLPRPTCLFLKLATLTLSADLPTIDSHPHLLFDYANDEEKWLEHYDRAYEKVIG